MLISANLLECRSVRKAFQCIDDEFKEWSQRLMNEFKIGLHILVISSITQAEISNAPEAVQNILLNMMDYDCEILLETEESMASGEVH
jgi:hypothetical protein